MVVATHYEQLTFGSDHVSCVIWDIELVLDHDGLRHIIHYLVRIDEFCSWLKVENTWQNVLFKAIFELEVS